jgi:hypothetical protein
VLVASRVLSCSDLSDLDVETVTSEMETRCFVAPMLPECAPYCTVLYLSTVWVFLARSRAHHWSLEGVHVAEMSSDFPDRSMYIGIAYAHFLDKMGIP